MSNAIKYHLPPNPNHRYLQPYSLLCGHPQSCLLISMDLASRIVLYRHRASLPGPVPVDGRFRGKTMAY